MGKNHGKHGKKTDIAKFESMMAKVTNQTRKEAAEAKRKESGSGKNAKNEVPNNG